MEDQGKTGSLDGLIREHKIMDVIRNDQDRPVIDPSILKGTPGSSGFSFQTNVNRGTKKQKAARKVKRRAQRSARRKNR